MIDSTIRQWKWTTWILVIASSLCFVVVIGKILGTLEALSEPYNHEGELESIKHSGIFWSTLFGILGLAFMLGAVFTVHRQGHEKDVA